MYYDIYFLIKVTNLPKSYNIYHYSPRVVTKYIIFHYYDNSRRKRC